MRLTPNTRINAIVNHITGNDNLIMSSDLNMTFAEYLKLSHKNIGHESNRLKDMLQVDYTLQKTLQSQGYTFEWYVYQDNGKTYQFVALK
ncbi:MAG: hypothetical protein LC127_05970 [Chitinophagales bacterium]|nr:hypothetical protein [Chitinophagales bacterium]